MSHSATESRFFAETWQVLGAGALGCLWAAYLHEAGQPAALLLRTPERLASYELAGGLTRVGQTDNRPLALPAATHLPEGRTTLLVCTKAYDALDALAGHAGQLTADSNLVLFQNGMGAQQEIAARYSHCRVYAASTTEGAYLRSPYTVVHAGAGQTWIGPLNAKAQDAGAAPLQALFELPLETAYEPDIEQRLWSKLSVNAAINGLTALYGCLNGALVENPAYRRQMEALCQETELIMRALGRPPATSLYDAARAVARATAANRSSMLQDLSAGRRTEIDYINGYLCQQADRLGIHAPTHRWLTAAIHDRTPANKEHPHG